MVDAITGSLEPELALFSERCGYFLARRVGSPTSFSQVRHGGVMLSEGKY